MNEYKYYDFAKKFTPNPGLRTRNLSDFSGQQFREEVLDDFFLKNQKVLIDVSGIESSLGSSFLSEAFGGIAITHGMEKLKELVKFDESEKGQINYQEMISRAQSAYDRYNNK